MENKDFSLIKQKMISSEPMKNHTAFKIGGIADLFISINSIDELKQAILFAKMNKMPITIIGNGTNILVTDKGIRGLVIKIDIINLDIEKNKDFSIVTIGAGYKMMPFSIKLLNEEISGFEELSGIPGTIGGAIYMNAGAYGKEIKDIVISTTCMDYDGNIYTFTNEEQDFSYRHSMFENDNYIILETKLKLFNGKKDEIKQKMDDYLNKRKEKQPLDKPSAGSSFKRKEGIITAKLIDECGLKGYKIGGAMVSNKHAGFIVNENNATAEDVLKLIDHVKKCVFEKFGVKIEEEIRIIGEI